LLVHCPRLRSRHITVITIKAVIIIPSIIIAVVIITMIITVFMALSADNLVMLPRLAPLHSSAPEALEQLLRDCLARLQDTDAHSTFKAVCQVKARIAIVSPDCRTL
jgi:hypothetical protein